MTPRPRGLMRLRLSSITMGALGLYHCFVLPTGAVAERPEERRGGARHLRRLGPRLLQEGVDLGDAPVRLPLPHRRRLPARRGAAVPAGSARRPAASG